MIPTTLKYSPQFPVSEGSAVEIMPNNFPMGVIVLGGSCPSNRGNCPRAFLSHLGNGPKGVVVLVGNC